MNATWTYPLTGGTLRADALAGPKPAVTVRVDMGGEFLSAELTPAGARALAAALEACAVLVEDAIVSAEVDG